MKIEVNTKIGKEKKWNVLDASFWLPLQSFGNVTYIYSRSMWRYEVSSHASGKPSARFKFCTQAPLAPDHQKQNQLRFFRRKAKWSGFVVVCLCRVCWFILIYADLLKTLLYNLCNMYKYQKTSSPSLIQLNISKQLQKLVALPKLSKRAATTECPCPCSEALRHHGVIGHDLCDLLKTMTALS